jgi:UDP:flavonoid glycosyltransferase YjiC (YdhE family)
MAQDVRAACARAAPDVAVVDYMLPGALCGTEAAGCPTAAFVHTLYGALLDAGAPGPMAMAAGPADVAAARHALGLAPVDGLAGLLSRCGRLLVTSSPELDRPPDPLPANVRYVGPLFEDAGAQAGWAPPPGDAPLVVVSLGTTPMDEGPLLARLLDALAGEDVRVVATVGAHLAPWAEPVPANAVVTGYVRHAAVLPHAALVICHGGLGTIAAALAHGVPVLCLPLGRDQPDNAVAVERAGAGTFLPPDAPPADLRLAVVTLLDGARYVEAAARLAAAQSRPPSDAVVELASLASA